MSADGSAVTPPADTAVDTGYTPPNFGDVSDIHEALGFSDIEDLAPRIDRPGEVDGKVKDEVAAKREEKAKPGAKTADDDTADLKAIEARAKERRKAAQAARKKDAPAAAAPVIAKTETPAATAKLGPVEQAVKDTLLAIEALSKQDTEEATANGGAPAPTTNARKAELDAIAAKMDAIQESLKQTDAGKAALDEMKAQLKELNDDRKIRRHVAKTIESVADELPTLTDAKAIRAFNKEHGTDYTDAVEMVKEAAERYWTKFQVAPDWTDLAKRIEQKLKGDSAEQDTAEKPKKTSKTVSRNETSPPAARVGEEDISPEEAEARMYKRLGIEI